jgi:hypothetical protein
MAQLLQPQPQLDRPFFLSRTILTMINATMATSTSDTTIVPRFSLIQSISCHPFLALPAKVLHFLQNTS